LHRFRGPRDSNGWTPGLGLDCAQALLESRIPAAKRARPPAASRARGTFFIGGSMKPLEKELREELARLMQEHRDLDAAIEALQTSPGQDILQLQRLKKRKLQLKDRISFIEDEITPDIIA
jgi:hypothetical protein